jgi:hypothetical protein
MKLTELLLTQRQEAELAFVAALLKCAALDEALKEHAATLANEAGLKTIDPLARAAWDGLTRKAPPSDVVWLLHQLGLRKAGISDLVRVVQETGATDLAVILAALDKKGGPLSNN